MGAYLTIKSGLKNEGWWKDPKIVDEYTFTDPYNDYSVLAKVGLSWWVDIRPRLDIDRGLAEDELNYFIGLLEAKKSEICIEKIHRLNMLSVDEVNIYFQDRLQRLIAFLKRGMELDKKIYCSL